MSSDRQRYRDISPVTLQVVGGAVSSSLYCGEVEGLSGGLVESFMVEIYRCKLCQFTCGLQASISSHLLLRHSTPTLAYLGGADGGGGAEYVEEAGLRRGASPSYQLDLNAESKQSDEDEDFLLYNMLEHMSPPTCDISGEGGLQVAHTCEVSTLFEEDFPLKATQEEAAQSAHLMTLGLCRISASKPPPSSAGPPQPPPCPAQPSSPQQSSTRTPPSCPLCALTLPSRRLLDVHVRSHREAGGFSCVRCSQTSDSWEKLEPHWRSHCRRRRREEQRQQKKKKKAAASRTLRSAASRNAHQQTRGRRGRLIGRAGGKEAGCTDSQTLQSVTEKKNTRRKREEEEKEGKETGFCCSLCHRKCSTKLSLRRHLGTHGGEKAFTCPHCTYSSRLKASLLQHLRTHTGERPFRCAECSYASIDRSSLLRHGRTHSQEKPYSCQHCDYSSIQKKSLDLHARRHHTGEAFPCQQCEYSSPDRQLLQRHVRRHHDCDLPEDRAL